MTPQTNNDFNRREYDFKIGSIEQKVTDLALHLNDKMDTLTQSVNTLSRESHKRWDVINENFRVLSSKMDKDECHKIQVELDKKVTKHDIIISMLLFVCTVLSVAVLREVAIKIFRLQ